jgi:hypothetical protein
MDFRDGLAQASKALEQLISAEKFRVALGNTRTPPPPRVGGQREPCRLRNGRGRRQKQRYNEGMYPGVSRRRLLHVP